MKKSFFHILFYFLCISVLPGKLYAQQFFYRLYNMNDGLPGTQIYNTYEDPNGYLWVCEKEGISRFDGKQFINYSITEGLPSLSTNTIFQDSKRRLWVSTSFGMAQFINGRFLTFPTSDHQTNLYVFRIIETKEKKIWALTDKGVYEFDGSKWKNITLYPGNKYKKCRDILEANGNLFVNYGNAIFCKTMNHQWQLIATNHNYGSLFNKMILYSNTIWVSTRTNIFRIRNLQLKPLYKKAIDSTSYFFDYFFDSKNRLWLAGDGFLKVSKPGDWQHFTQVGNQYNYSNIYEDSDKNIWVGTDNGLIKLKEVACTNIGAGNPMRPGGIYNIIAMHDGRILVSSGTTDGMVIYANNKFTKILPPPNSPDNNYYKDPVDGYTYDQDNNLWIATRFNKLLLFDGKKLTDYSSLLHLTQTESIYDIEYIKKRNRFFICADSNLLAGNYSGFSPFVPRNTPLPHGNPLIIHLLQNGLLFLYIEGKGAYSIDSANNLFSLNKSMQINAGNKESLMGISFYEGSDEHFWISFPGIGLNEYGFTKNKIPVLENHFDVSNGLQSNHVMSITGDGQNRIWVATNQGLDILQLTKNKFWEVFNFAKTEELGVKQSEIEKLVTDPQGNVWFSSPDHIFRFDVDSIGLKKETPRVIIEKVMLAFKKTNWSTITDSLYSYYLLPWQPVLHYNQNSLGISFNATDLSIASSNPEYSYRLLPIDTAWSTPSKSKFVSLAELPSGKYQFMVKAKDRASGWSPPALFSFTIRTPFWNQWWFRLTIIALAAFIIINIFMARIRRIKNDAFVENQLREMEMKALKAQMNPHFVFNAINSIQALVANDKKMEGIHYIGSFSRLLRQVFDNSENNVISLDKELETVGLYIQLETLRLNMELDYTKNIPDNVVPEYEKIPPLILQPFVENALWHGLSYKQGRKEITINVSIRDQWLLCDIIDNGIGRAKAQELKEKSQAIHLSKAIEITRKRLIDFNEDSLTSPIEFTDLFDNGNNPCGTKVTLRIKRKTGHSSSSFNKSK
ncbi:MAG TPA: two-component regulator propeller domain-containing protein [Hanamia sp.]|nr:two-component regulator propeller domain-containing protein [Hanamia sp.]